MTAKKISEPTLLAINKHVDAYIDELRFEFIHLRHNRDIKELSPGKYVIRDADLIIDRNQNYDEILRHPIEDYFIPEKVELFETEFILELEPPEFVKFADFDVSGVIGSKEIPLDDPRISDDEIQSLISQTCFDDYYQNLCPEVRTFLEEFYRAKQPEHFEKIMARIRPFLGI
jgi:hypothetical protein